jgi:ABC-type lipoprotein export system ATPase subunit
MLELVGVGFSRGDLSILEGAFLRVEPGQVVLLSGPSGIGKTTLLGLVGGFHHADEGEVRVFGRDLAKLRASSVALLRRHMSYVSQELELIDDETALSNVRLALEVCGVGRREATDRSLRILEEFEIGVAAHRPVHELSTGQRRRVCLARALVRDAAVFIADEPSNDLDEARVERLAEMIERRRRKNVLCFVATNDPRLVCHARDPGWRHLELRDRQLMPAGEHPVEEMAIPNVVPFPVAAGASGDWTP